MTQPANEAVHADEWLEQILGRDEALAGRIAGVFMDVQGTDEQTPFIRCDLLDEDDVRVIGQQRVMTKLVYLVRVISRGPAWEEARAIADRIDAILHGAAGATPTLRILAVTRARPYKRSTVETRVVYRHAGGIYELLVQPL